MIDIKAGILAAILLAVVGAIVAILRGVQTVRSSWKIPYFRLKQERMVRGWRTFFLGIFLIIGAWWLASYGEPVAYMFYEPSVTPSLTPTITLSPTITLTPTITLSPTITWTPAVSNTPTASLTPFVPPVVADLYTSKTTPNPAAIFSPLVFARGIDLNSYEPVEPGTVFENPIRRIVAIYSYDQMMPGAQWTALWYRNGELVHYETAPWDGTTGGYGYTEWAPDPGEWQPGEYEVQIFVGMEWKVVGRFTVTGDAPAPRPTSRPSVTITDTATPVVRLTPTPSVTPAPTLTPLPSPTPIPSSTRAPTFTRPPSDTPWPSQTPTVTQTRFPTSTPRPSDTPWPKTTP